MIIFLACEIFTVRPLALTMICCGAHLINTLFSEQQTPEEWRIVFFITAGVYAIGIVGYLLLASGELQPWAEDKSKSGVEMDDLKQKDARNTLLPPGGKSVLVAPNEHGDHTPLSKDLKI